MESPGSKRPDPSLVVAESEKIGLTSTPVGSINKSGTFIPINVTIPT